MIDILNNNGEKLIIKDDGSIETDSETLLKDFEYDIENKKNNISKVKG